MRVYDSMFGVPYRELYLDVTALQKEVRETCDAVTRLIREGDDEGAEFLLHNMGRKWLPNTLKEVLGRVRRGFKERLNAYKYM